jgi:hypothetical protein
VGRLVRLTKHYARVYRETEAHARQAVIALVDTLEHADSLPLQGDVEAPLPARHATRIEQLEGRPTVSAYVRRVPRHRLWLWYRLHMRTDAQGNRQEEVRLVTLTTAPPFT